MPICYDTQAPKCDIKVSVNSDLFSQSRALNINLSATLETGLAALVKAKHQEAWLAQHQQAIAAYNQQADKSGAFGDILRTF